jgi:hypothetical protein
MGAGHGGRCYNAQTRKGIPMHEVSWGHWIIFFLTCAVLLVPAGKILSRAGWNGWLCLVLLVPFVNVIALWYFAFARWPALQNKSGYV